MLSTSRLNYYFLFFVCLLLLVSTLISSSRMVDLPVVEREIEIVKPTVDQAHLKCLATNIYWESAGEPFMGQVAVARVVMNRITHGFAANPCTVVYQALFVRDTETDTKKKICQFSWVCEGKKTPRKNASYQQAEHIAYMILSENKWHDVIPENILFFHNKTVTTNLKYLNKIMIGNHIFYSKLYGKTENNQSL